MPKKDPRINAYIKKAQPFARPILKHLQQVVHRACPNVEETIKWRMPFFEFNGPLCMMAAFKAHCVFGFWKGELLFGKENQGAMGHFGRITSMSDLPSDKQLAGYIRKATELNARGIQKKRTPRGTQKISAPLDLKAALAKNAKARKTFDNFSYSHKNEYVKWITGAKRDETRKKRLKLAVEWLAQGKPQNWRYM